MQGKGNKAQVRRGETSNGVCDYPTGSLHGNNHDGVSNVCRAQRVRGKHFQLHVIGSGFHGVAFRVHLPCYIALGALQSMQGSNVQKLPQGRDRR
jgi:hypothetical protein